MSDTVAVPVLRRMARERGVRLDFIDGPTPWAIRRRAGDPVMARLRDRESVRDYLHGLPQVPGVRY